MKRIEDDTAKPMVKMKNQLTRFLGLAILVVAMVQCNVNENSLEATLKLSPNDPFQGTMVSSQTFEIDAKEDNVVEGESGTVLVLPKGCFKNGAGETVTENVKVELAEALALDQMLLSNLTTTLAGKLLETGGMIYLNATSNGEQLSISKGKPVYIEIPTEKRKPGMMAYKGIRDENGNMDWVNPQELETFLVSVDLHLLDFYPEGFEAEVTAGLPYKNHQTPTKELLDSLYYSLSVSDGSELLAGLKGTDFNEAYYNLRKEVVNGRYTETSYEVTRMASDSTSEEGSLDAALGNTETCGIDPAIIKTIKSDEFQNTLIATREFETRLQTIFKTCRDDILEIYIQNLDKDLWELDSMAGAALGEQDQSSDFYGYFKQGLTNVENGGSNGALLKAYYHRRLTEIKAQLEAAKAKAMTALQAKNEVAQQVADEYKELLWKREKYRMDKYGFDWTETGWINVDVGTIPKDWRPQRLEMIVDGGKDYDRVHTYVVYTSIKSLYRLNSSDNETFYVGNHEKKQMLMPKKKLAIAISIAYKGEASFLAVKEFETGTEQDIRLALKSSTTAEISAAIQRYDSYEQENRIDKDLEYMALFAQEKKRQEKLKSERDFIGRLWRKSYPCCEIIEYVTTWEETVRYD